MPINQIIENQLDGSSLACYFSLYFVESRFVSLYKGNNANHCRDY